MKDRLKQLARKYGVNFCSTDHLGVDIELDVARLAASEPLKIIFDVGGNFGQTALKFSAAFPGATLHTFEPVPTSFARLLKAIQGHAKIKPYNLALGDSSGSISIALTDAAGTNTILKNPNSTESVNVPIDTLDAFATAHSIESIDLLKIDVEGYEIPVLKGAENLLQRGAIRFIFAECVLPVDPVLPHTSFFDLNAYLTPRGFSFVTYYGEGFRLSDGCALGNVLYALRSRLPAKAGGRILNIA